MPARDRIKEFGRMGALKLLGLLLQLFLENFFSLFLLILTMVAADWTLDRFWEIGMRHFAVNSVRKAAVDLLLRGDAGLIAWTLYGLYFIVLTQAALRWGQGRRFHLWRAASEAGPLLAPAFFAYVLALTAGSLGFGLPLLVLGRFEPVRVHGEIAAGAYAAVSLLVLARLSPSVAAALKEKKPAAAALARSVRITKGSWLLGAVLTAVPLALSAGLDLLSGQGEWMAALLGRRGAAAAEGLLHRLFAPLFPMAAALYYLEIVGRRRLTHEGRMREMVS